MNIGSIPQRIADKGYKRLKSVKSSGPNYSLYSSARKANHKRH